MSLDYIILGVIAMLGIAGGIFLHSQAKDYRARRHVKDKQPPRQPAH